MKGRAALGLLLSAAVLLAAAPAALAALSVTRAELSGGQLRVEGQGATPNATITLDGVAMGTAASDGRFRIERSGFSSPTCGDLGGGDAVAYDANADGSIVVGRSSDAQGNYFHGFRWTVAGGMEGLPIGEATDVSADGNAAVGFALLWTAADGVTSVGASNNAFGISPEGDVVVGMTSASGRGHAMRWTRAGGVQDLGTLSGSEAFADSASWHGAVVVGQALVLQNPYRFWHAFRWMAARGMEDLKTLGGPQSAAYDVTPDGSVIVGKSLISSSSASERAFRWTTQTGIRELQRELLDAGVTAVQSWILFSATSVSADGRVIVGYGFNPARQWEAFRAVLPVPR